MLRVSAVVLSCVGCLVAGGCNKNRAEAESNAADTLPAPIAACMSALESARAFANDGLSDVDVTAVAKVESAFREQLSAVGGACKGMYKKPACANAVAAMAASFPTENGWMDSCKEAYCPELDPPPPACGGANSDDDYRQLLVAIWSLDWGKPTANRISARSEALNIDPQTLSKELMNQVDAKLGAMLKEQRPLSEVVEATLDVFIQPTGATRLTVSSGQALEAADLTALESTLGSLGLNPSTTQVYLHGTNASFQTMVSVMDGLIGHGFNNIAVGSDKGDENKDAADAPSSPAAPLDKEELEQALTLTITRDEVVVDGEAVASIADVTAGKAMDALVAKVQAKHPQPGRVVVQADRNTKMALLINVLDRLAEADFGPVMFAVNRKSP